MKEITFDWSNASVAAQEMDCMKEAVALANHTLLEKTGAGNDFWVGCGCPLITIMRNLTVF